MSDYVFDTSAFRVLRNYYPERFPSFWKKFQTMVDSGRIISVREVERELQDQLQEPWLLEWIDTRKQLFPVPTAAETAFVAKIFKVPHFRSLVGERQRLKGKPVADPFVVAAAACMSATVVTQEAVKSNAAKIPNVCQHFKIGCTNVEGFLKARGWTF